MSTSKAKTAFDSARKATDPSENPALYDLAVGLFCLSEAVEAIERELKVIKARIS